MFFSRQMRIHPDILGATSIECTDPGNNCSAVSAWLFVKPGGVRYGKLWEFRIQPQQNTEILQYWMNLYGRKKKKTLLSNHSFFNVSLIHSQFLLANLEIHVFFLKTPSGWIAPIKKTEPFSPFFEKYRSWLLVGGSQFLIWKSGWLTVWCVKLMEIKSTGCFPAT